MYVHCPEEKWSAPDDLKLHFLGGGGRGR